jgi:hypothetical protein
MTIGAVHGSTVAALTMTYGTGYFGSPSRRITIDSSICPLPLGSGGRLGPQTHGSASIFNVGLSCDP